MKQLDAWEMRSKRLKKERVLSREVAKRLLDLRSPIDRKIDALLAQKCIHFTKRKMLREAYAGRLEELINYLGSLDAWAR